MKTNCKRPAFPLCILKKKLDGAFKKKTKNLDMF